MKTNTSKTFSNGYTASAYSLSLLLAAPAFAAVQLEEVIVTAQKRAQSLQTTPMSISAFQGNSLEAFGITSFDDVANASPSITFSPYPNSTNLLILYIRGQGVADPAQITTDGSVGLYQDGFYISRPQASTFDLADLERVEVLRGPQGTLYGRNTTGGAVNLISSKPSGEFGLKQKLTFGSRDEFRSLTTVELDAWRGVSAKLSLLGSSIDGFVDNPGTGEDFGLEEQIAGRIDLNWQASDDFEADYFYERGSLDSTPNYYQNPAWNNRDIESPAGVNTYHSNAGEPQSTAYRAFDLEKSTSDFQTHGLTLNWTLNENLSIRSLTGYRELEWRAFQDFAEAFGFISSTNPDFFLQPTPITFTSDNAVESDQVSQEITLIGNFAEQAISYVAGLYYFDESSDSDGYGEQSGLGTLNTITRSVTADSTSRAVYGQATWTPQQLEEKLDVTVGARYTRDERRATRDLINVVNGTLDEAKSQLGAANKDNYSQFNPSFTLAYAAHEDLNLYGRLVSGYKAGGSSESGPVDQFGNTVEPEKVISYEVGLKSYWLDRRASFNLALFESQFEDMQIAFSVDPFDPSIVQSYNAGEATVRGLEADLFFQPTENFSVGLQYAYLDSDLEEVVALPGTVFDPATNAEAQGFYSVGDNIADSFTLPYAPEHSFVFSVDGTLLQTQGITVSAHMDYRYQSAVFAGSTAGKSVPGRNNLKIPSYGLVNLRVAAAYNFARGDKIEIAVWGKNVTDKEYPQSVLGLGSVVPTANQLGEVIFGYVQQGTMWSEPARFGVDVNYVF